MSRNATESWVVGIVPPLSISLRVERIFEWGFLKLYVGLKKKIGNLNWFQTVMHHNVLMHIINSTSTQRNNNPVNKFMFPNCRGQVAYKTSFAYGGKKQQPLNGYSCIHAGYTQQKLNSANDTRNLNRTKCKWVQKNILLAGSQASISHISKSHKGSSFHGYCRSLSDLD